MERYFIISFYAIFYLQVQLDSNSPF